MVSVVDQYDRWVNNFALECKAAAKKRSQVKAHWIISSDGWYP